MLTDVRSWRRHPVPVQHDEQKRTLERFVAERVDRLLRTAALLAAEGCAV